MRIPKYVGGQCTFQIMPWRMDAASHAGILRTRIRSSMHGKISESAEHDQRVAYVISIRCQSQVALVPELPAIPHHSLHVSLLCQGGRPELFWEGSCFGDEVWVTPLCLCRCRLLFDVLVIIELLRPSTSLLLGSLRCQTLNCKSADGEQPQASPSR